MKAFFTFLTIALVAQLTFAAAMPRSKRDTEDAIKALQNIVDEEKTMVEAVLKDMPTTEAYASFRKSWDNFMEVYNYKGEDVLCVVKVQGLMEGFGDIIANYKAPDAPAEAKEMLRLFNKHGLPQHIVNTKKNLDSIKTVDESKIFDNC